MNFRRHRRREAPEINLIPFIDVLLVVVIFLAVSTSFSRFTELQIQLPTSAASAPTDPVPRIEIAVSQDGRYQLGDQAIAGGDPDALTRALRQAAAGRSDTLVVINADAGARHQAVVDVLEAARRAGLAQLTFATRQAP